METAEGSKVVGVTTTTNVYAVSAYIMTKHVTAVEVVVVNVWGVNVATWPLLMSCACGGTHLG